MNKLIATAALLSLAACSTAVIENPSETAAPEMTSTKTEATTVTRAAPMETNVNTALERANQALKFAFDDATVPMEAKSEISELAAQMKRENINSIKIEGFADSQGDVAYNQKLSRERAQSVAALIRQEGINRVEVKGLGESNPVASNDTDAGRAENRRANISVKGQVLGSGR